MTAQIFDNPTPTPQTLTSHEQSQRSLDKGTARRRSGIVEPKAIEPTKAHARHDQQTAEHWVRLV